MSYQQLIVVAFHEQGWQKRIDDPLPGDGRINRKRRLHDAIKFLNCRLLAPSIRFHSDGSGRGIEWEAVAAK